MQRGSPNGNLSLRRKESEAENDEDGHVHHDEHGVCLERCTNHAEHDPLGIGNDGRKVVVRRKTPPEVAAGQPVATQDTRAAIDGEEDE